jgi:hypothetical protein
VKIAGELKHQRARAHLATLAVIEVVVATTSEGEFRQSRWWNSRVGALKTTVISCRDTGVWAGRAVAEVAVTTSLVMSRSYELMIKAWIMKERDAYPDTSGGPVVWDLNVDFSEGPSLPSGSMVWACSSASEHLEKEHEPG